CAELEAVNAVAVAEGERSGAVGADKVATHGAAVVEVEDHAAHQISGDDVAIRGSDPADGVVLRLDSDAVVMGPGGRSRRVGADEVAGDHVLARALERDRYGEVAVEPVQ